MSWRIRFATICRRARQASSSSSRAHLSVTGEVNKFPIDWKGWNCQAYSILQQGWRNHLGQLAHFPFFFLICHFWDYFSYQYLIIFINENNGNWRKLSWETVRPNYIFHSFRHPCAALVVSAVWQRTSDRTGGAARGGGCRLEVSSLLRVR